MEPAAFEQVLVCNAAHVKNGPSTYLAGPLILGSTAQFYRRCQPAGHLPQHSENALNLRTWVSRPPGPGPGSLAAAVI
jgi:hypothetical protein